MTTTTFGLSLSTFQAGSSTWLSQFRNLFLKSHGISLNNATALKSVQLGPVFDSRPGSAPHFWAWPSEVSALSNVTSVVVVRHPMDRAASWHYDKVVGGVIEPKTMLTAIYGEGIGNDDYIRRRLERGGKIRFAIASNK